MCVSKHNARRVMSSFVSCAQYEMTMHHVGEWHIRKPNTPMNDDAYVVPCNAIGW